jgi:uroporphyrinogen-III synthase
MRPLLVLRPEPGAAATVARAQAAGFEAIAAPLFTTSPLAWDAPAAHAHDALMLTSANAVRHSGPGLDLYRSLPVYAVGEATASAAREAGFQDVRIGARDAAALVALMVRDGIHRPLHLAGRDYRDVPTTLTIERRLVYAAEPVAALPGAAHIALERQAVALIHSPRAGALLARLLAEAGIDASHVPVAAISAAAAAGPWRAVAIAAAPDDGALLAAAAGLCEKG